MYVQIVMCILKNNASRCVVKKNTTKTKNVFCFGCIFVIDSFQFFDVYYIVFHLFMMWFVFFLDCIFVKCWCDCYECIFIGFYVYTKSFIYFFDFIFDLLMRFLCRILKYIIFLDLVFFLWIAFSWCVDAITIDVYL